MRAAVILLVAFFLEISTASAQTVWNVSLWGKRRAVTVSIEHLAQELEARTNGALRLVMHYGEAISPARENIDGISLGVFEAAHICPSYHPGKTPALAGLELPFLPFEDMEAAHRVNLKMHRHPVIEQELGRFNARVLQHVIAPRYEFMGRGDPLTIYPSGKACGCGRQALSVMASVRWAAGQPPCRHRRFIQAWNGACSMRRLCRSPTPLPIIAFMKCQIGTRST